MPMLDALAANEELRSRSLRRFERDDPPPYASSTESEVFSDDYLEPPPPRELPEELIALMEQPITDEERKHIAFDLGDILNPVDRYHIEANREETRVWKYRSNKIFHREQGIRRCGVFVRHNIKRRWEKLGIWNPEWGFAGRNVQPNDNADGWNWRWEEQTADDSESDGFATRTKMRQLVARALRLRQNLRRGENAPVLPRSCLKQDATASQAESFIISRPWFIFRLELAEERKRYYRLSNEQQRRYPHSTYDQVIKWWKERGDWKEEFDRYDHVTSWKWRHESPSPEPEDLTPINNMKDSPLDTMDMDFTPSEIDDLETIELPDSEQPDGFWMIRRDACPQPPFPGQFLEPYRPPPGVPGDHLYVSSGSLPRLSLFSKTPSEEGDDAILSEEYEEEDSLQDQEQNLPKSQRDVTNLLRQKLWRQRQRQLQDKMDSAQNRDESPPLPRRSARIAGIKRPAEDLPSEAASSKKPRGRAAPKAAVPATQPTTREIQRRKERLVLARPPPMMETQTRPKRGRGRPRKENALNSRSVVTKKKAARMPALAGRGRGRAAARGTPAVSRRRRRQRLNE